MKLNKRQKIALTAIVEDDLTPILLAGVTITSTVTQCPLMWLFPLILLREQHIRIRNFFETWIQEYLDYDFYQHFRMSRETSHKLLTEIGRKLIAKRYQGGEVPVSLEKTLLACLWYVSKGATLISTADRFNLAIATTWICIDTIINVLNTLKELYIPWPTPMECVTISEDFFRKSKYPDVIGAIDCTHILCKIPNDQHSSYQDRKFNHSITLQGIATSSRIFTNVSVGYPGSIHDARILKESSIGRAMYLGQNDLFYGQYHLIGDSAYPCKPWLMTPFRDTGRLTQEEKRHNKRLSSARIVIEHVFGLLKERWRICKYINVYSIEKAVNIIAACCVLHNFCLINKDDFNAELELVVDQRQILHPLDQDGFAKRRQICGSLE